MLWLRFRFILIRTMILSSLIVLILQILQSEPTPDEENSFEQKTTEIVDPVEKENLFWAEIIGENIEFDEAVRLRRISQTDVHPLKKFNMTTMFEERFRDKLQILLYRDGRTPFKQHLEKRSSTKLPSIIEIFDETSISSNSEFCQSENVFHPECPVKSCRWTCERSKFNYTSYRRAHFFRSQNIDLENLNLLQSTRTEHDIWILFVDATNTSLEPLNKVLFNWTISFRQDSEVSTASFGFLAGKLTVEAWLDVDQPFLLNILDQRHAKSQNLGLEHRIFTNFRFRQRRALWFLNECPSDDALNYVEILKRAYEVRSFGECGDEQCVGGSACEEDQMKLSMFYLAFESSRCTDYITTNFWRSLAKGMIPIVFGPRKEFYLDLKIPPGSFIHVDDFSRISDLAAHLISVGNDYFLYREYFEWSNSYDILYKSEDLRPIQMCELCTRLTNHDIFEHSFYKDLDRWFESGCRN